MGGGRARTDGSWVDGQTAFETYGARAHGATEGVGLDPGLDGFAKGRGPARVDGIGRLEADAVVPLRREHDGGSMALADDVHELVQVLPAALGHGVRERRMPVAASLHRKGRALDLDIDALVAVEGGARSACTGAGSTTPRKEHVDAASSLLAVAHLRDGPLEAIELGQHAPAPRFEDEGHREGGVQPHPRTAHAYQPPGPEELAAWAIGRRDQDSRALAQATP